MKVSMLTLVSIDAFRIIRPLAYQFKTSFAKREYISHVIVVLKWKNKNRKEITSLGEATTHSEPYYNGEFDLTAISYIQRVSKLLLLNSFKEPRDLHSILGKNKVDKQNRFAIAALDIAFHDAFAQEEKISLAKYLATHYRYTKNILSEVPIGVSIGMVSSPRLFAQVALSYVNDGVNKIKLKIEPGNDLIPLKLILKTLKGKKVKIAVDANSSYSFANSNHLRDLIYIASHVNILEQPLGFDDIWSHAKFISKLIEKKIKVKVCLDECIKSLRDVVNLLEQINLITKLPFSRIYPYISINIKISRIGGLTPAMEVAQFCKKNSITIMPGGMHEYSIGRSAIVSFTALDPDFEHGDSEGAETYYPAGEITYQEGKSTTVLNTNKNKCLTVPDGVGLGIGLINKNGLIEVAEKTYVVKKDLLNDHWTPTWNKQLYKEVIGSLFSDLP